MSIFFAQHRAYQEREARGIQILRSWPAPNVAPPGVIQRIVVLQETPDHPKSLLRAGVQGPNVGQITAIAQRLIVTQQMPDHPRSRFWIGPPPVFRQIPFVAPLIVRQQMPGHPSSMFFAGNPPVVYEDVQLILIV